MNPTQSSPLRPIVLQARERLATGRERLKQRHSQSTPAVQVCAQITDLLDFIVLDLYQEALRELADPGLESRIALIPNGGYGRRDVAPYSDVDLLLLHSAGAEKRVEALAKKLVQFLGDSGLTLGFSVRTPVGACKAALRDPTIFTTLTEARFLAGSVQLFTKFMARFRRVGQQRSSSLITVIDEARREERRQYGDTAFLLRPNIKKSRGGLRDIQLLRWVGFARYGESEPSDLERLGVLSRADRNVMRNAYHFLLRVRNEMHFFADKPQDTLSREEQVRIATSFGYQGDRGLLPVEQFMKDYFEHVSGVRYTSTHFLTRSKSRSTIARRLGWFFGRQLERDYFIGVRRISATRHGRVKLVGNLSEVLRLMDLANRFQKPIDHETWIAIRDDMVRRDALELSEEAIERFLSLLSEPGRLADLLRRLHELRVLEKIIPAVEHARCLMQFNEYHKYTVDEHSIRTIESAESFIDDRGVLGDVYRGLKNKRILHLALLVHDLGKGYTEDHSKVGLTIAVETAARLGLSDGETEFLKFLVCKHLIMAHTALQKNLNDQALIVRFALEVGSIEILQMLYVLTCADISGVGPGALTDWKRDLITDLYHRTRSHLDSDSQTPSSEERIRQLREAVRENIGEVEDQEWWERQIAGLPSSYLFADEPERIATELGRLRQLPKDEILVWARYLPDRDVVEYTIGTHEEIADGIFHRLTGALTSCSTKIMFAEIHTLADHLVLDRFHVQDSDFTGEPPKGRIAEVREALVAALKNKNDEPPRFRRTWQAEVSSNDPNLSPLPRRVRFDNSTSVEHTILTVFAYDRVGLLYAITKTLSQLGLSVHAAKIGTYLDQVVDVFYVTEESAEKIRGDVRFKQIRNTLLEAIAEVESKAMA
ncbi:MAG: [protein-PII] uridylyltransferase [Pirellulaceae bacterium]|nr:[protein-PII] uridylyltransferase [Pirellulaceae bacterium]